MMALDFEALKKKLQEKENEGGGDITFWRPKVGRNEIRVLPSATGDNNFYAEAGTRWNVGPNKKKVFVPIDWDEACPLREFVDGLKESDDADDKALAKKMNFSRRYLFNIIDTSLDKDDEKYGKVQLYEAPGSVFKEIIALLVDPDYNNLINEEDGHNIIIDKSGEGLKTEYSVRPRKETTAIPNKDWKDGLVDLARFATPKSYEDRLAILTGDSGSTDESKGNTDDVSSAIKDKVEESTKPEPTPEPEPAKPEEEEPKAEKDDVRDEIAKLLAQKR